MKNIIIFGSGKGTNAENIIRSSDDYKVIKLVTDNSKSGFINLSNKYNIPLIINNDINSIDIKEFESDLLILAGFLKKIPSQLIQKFRGKIINIHPSLLPKYGGKGMYGDNVHKSVLQNNEKETGITIHHVDEEYDTGSIIFQKSLNIENMTLDDVIENVHKLEYEYLPIIIKQLLYAK